MSLAVKPSNAHQLKASDPTRHIWVAASAGSGKTKVLTDRVLRLLLEGVPPSKILCITYTKAAAAEMQTRVQETLSLWVMMPDETLAAHLTAITGEQPSSKTLRYARTLFATLLEDNPALRIQTIHSFCQSLLARFPLEAGVPPSFDLLDDRSAREMLKSAQNWLLNIGLGEHDDQTMLPIKTALLGLSMSLGESKFQEIINAIISNRRHFERLFSTMSEHFTDPHQQTEYLRSCLYHTVNLDPHITSMEDVKNTWLNYTPSDRAKIQALADTITSHGSDTEKKSIPALRQFAHDETLSEESLEGYLGYLLTDKMEARKNIPNAGVKKQLAWLEDFVRDEQNRIKMFLETRSALQAATDALQLITLAQALFARYTSMKQARGLLDFEDLIFSARQLLCGTNMMPWVLFKLDGGLDHVLVDEAQDTSPLQWELVRAIIDEFFSGEGVFSPTQTRQNRTVFIVGDEKQSIYRFQGADIATFAHTRAGLQRHLRERSLELEEVRLSMSYRSTPAILAAVDAVFAGTEARAGLGDNTFAIEHTAFKSDKAGLVELWPLIKTEKEKSERFFPFHTSYQDHHNSKLLLAVRLADTIAHWLHTKRPLHALGRPVRAGDILILVRQRGELVSTLSRELKKRGVPIAGLDRMELTSHIAVMDMLALAQFLLLPEDDLTLACLLKSPLYGIREETLFELCHDRGKQTVWARLRAYEGNDTGALEAQDELAELLKKADYSTPYALFAELLFGRRGRERMMARMGDEVIDPLSVFLSEAMHYEQLHAPSLQGFLHWMNCGENIVKRDMEQGIDAVRIMTVHASKGLQAPIVILPDTTSEPVDRPTILVTEHDAGHPLFFLSASQASSCKRVENIKTYQKMAVSEEYHRLLYVALTRAEEELYICGFETGKTKSRGCWYNLVNDGFSRLEQVQTLACDHAYPYWQAENQEILRYATLQPDAPSVTPSHAASSEAIKERVTLPQWATRDAPYEPTPPRPLAPSKIADHIPAAIIPTTASQQASSHRATSYGTMIHRLLHLLSPCPADDREAFAHDYLVRHAPKTDPKTRDSIIHEVLSVMQHPDFHEVFADGSLAEVPLTGVIWDNIVISGQVDRLVITPSHVMIIDFKTGQPSQDGAIPKAYLEQMRAYHALLTHIYPQHEIRCALLYTSTLTLIPIRF